MVVSVGCAGTEPMPAGKSLCDRFGGKFSIPAVVDQLLANVAADTRINGRCAITDIRKLKATLSITSVWQQEGPAPTAGAI
jgi:hypothetical protein